jgi:hypothetical protein
MPLPPYAPELNPVEQLWLNIKQRYLSNMAFKDTYLPVAPVNTSATKNG